MEGELQSRNDIEQELGKEISIYPLDFKNFSLNLGRKSPSSRPFFALRVYRRPS